MSAGEFVGDIGNIWTRLFDHRPFLSGEIKFFLKEFEGKASDEVLAKLLQILEKTIEIRYTQIECVKIAADTHLPTVNATLEVAVSMCNRILEKEETYRSDTSIVTKGEIRKVEWEAFIEDMAKKCTQVDKTFEEKEAELIKFYADLEKKLHLND